MLYSVNFAYNNIKTISVEMMVLGVIHSNRGYYKCEENRLTLELYIIYSRRMQLLSLFDTKAH